MIPTTKFYRKIYSYRPIFWIFYQNPMGLFRMEKMTPYPIIQENKVNKIGHP